MERELVIAENVADEAVRIFLAAQPRVVLLSGGSTPRAFYQRLFGISYQWDEVEFYFGDERCVSPEDERSNARMAAEALLSGIPARSFPINGAACDAAGYERALRERFGEELRFDLAVYGLGPDGHTASLFPGMPEVEVEDRWVVRVPEAGLEPYVPRVTMTLPALSSATTGVFLVAGPEKKEALRRLMGNEDIPAARVRPQRLIVVADAQAAFAAW